MCCQHRTVEQGAGSVRTERAPSSALRARIVALSPEDPLKLSSERQTTLLPAVLPPAPPALGLSSPPISSRADFRVRYPRLLPGHRFPEPGCAASKWCSGPSIPTCRPKYAKQWVGLPLSLMWTWVSRKSDIPHVSGILTLDQKFRQTVRAAKRSYDRVEGKPERVWGDWAGGSIEG